MPTPLDPATLSSNVIALRGLLLQREDEHAAELQAARDGLKEQLLRNEQLTLRLAKLLRERFGASSEMVHGALDQLELVLADLEEQAAETAPPAPDEPVEPRHRGASSPASRCPRHYHATWWSMPRPAPVRSAAVRCARWVRT